MVAAFAILSVHPIQVRAEIGNLTEYEIKVGLLYQFAVYTQWPKEALPESESEFVLGILGDNPFGSALEFLRGKTVKSRKFVVKHFASPQEIHRCHMLFIAAKKKNVALILKDLDKPYVLTISESEDFIELGGMINFVLVDTGRSETVQVRFEINKAAADQAGLKLHSGFLKAAVRLIQ